jgi:hypothetical protein
VLTFVLANDGDATATISGTSYGGDGSGYVITGMPASLDPGAKATVTVTYAPSPGKDGGYAGLFFTSNSFTPVSVILDAYDGPLTLGCPVCKTLTGGDYVQADYGQVGWQSSKSEPFTLTNTWLSDVTVTKLAPTYGYAVDGAPAVPFTIHPGGSVTFSVSTVPGVATNLDLGGDLVIDTDARPGVTTIDCTLDAQAVSGFVMVTPSSSVDFGPVDVRATEPAIELITIENVGYAPLTITDWPALTGGAFTSPAVAPVTIPAGGSQSVPVTYRPTAEGATDTATLVVSIDGIIGQPQPLAQTITLTGHGADRHLRITGAPIAFPPTFLDPSGPGTPVAAVTLTNTGEAPLDISALRIEGDPDFELIDAAPITVAGGKSTDLHVRFAPHAVGSFTGTLVIVHDDATSPTPDRSEVEISGSGVSRMIGVSPAAPIDLGRVHVGDENGRSITITNLDPSRSMTISGVGVGQPETSYWPVFTTPYVGMPLVLAPGASATLDVDFTPPDVGPQRGALLLYFDGDSLPDAQIALTGTGLPARDTYYACAAGDGSGGGGLVIALAIGLVSVRRRRAAGRR